VFWHFYITKSLDILFMKYRPQKGVSLLFKQILITMNQKINKTTKIAIFRNKKIRKTIYKNEWWFVIVDVVAALTDSVQPGGYIKDMRRRDSELSKGWGQIATPLLIQTAGGVQKLNCANTEGIFRIIQSIPSPKSEPFKRWLARVGYERVQEIEDPELAQKRARALYKATFGVTPSQHKKIKGLKRENLRDHMSDLELLFSQLGEAATTEITKTEHPQGFEKNKQVSRRGGKIAGDARFNLEKETGRKVITSQNYLPKKHRAKLFRK